MQSGARRCRARLVVLLALLMCLAPGVSVAQSPAVSAPLQGVDAVTVAASIVAPEGALPHGLTEKRLQTLAELKLRSWALRVASSEEAEKTPGVTPRVEVDVTMLEARALQKLAGYAFFTRVAVTEPGTSLRNGASATTELWSQSFLSLSDPKQVVADVERSAGELLDQFINEWLRVRR